MTKMQYKIKKIGLGKLLSPFLGLLVCFFFVFSSARHLTPYSVSVSGYTRSDGTYVRGYNRRPPGGARHDSPYEIVIKFSVIGGIILSIYGYDLIKKFHNMDVISEFKKEIKYNDDYPQKNFYFLDIPMKSSVPKKNWKCQLCHESIQAGSQYFYYAKERSSIRSRFCANCVKKMISDNLHNKEKEKIFLARCREVDKLRETQFREEFYLTFKVTIDNWEN